MTGDYTVEALAAQDRSPFQSGSAELDLYFRERVSQDERRRFARCFVALDRAGLIAGYYTLAASSLPLASLNETLARKLPRYPVVPTILLGRLAVAAAHQGRGLGAALVEDALARAGRSEVVGHLMIVEAIDASAARFYANLSFQALPNTPLRLARRL